MLPYIVFYASLEHALGMFEPVFEIFNKDPNFEASVICAHKRLGESGKNFNLGRIKVKRKPSALVIFRAWQSPDRDVALAAKQNNIPVIMINHGAMFVRNDKQKYKRSIAPAKVNCVWGKHDYDLWKSWNTIHRFEITGNPLHDCIIDYSPPEIDVPEKFALLLTPRAWRGYLDPSAVELNKIMPVIAKTHPIDTQKHYYKKHYQTFDAAWTLLPLLYKSELIITNVTSAFIPAIYWEKPIFIHSFDTGGYYFSDFKKKYLHVFNFKQDAIWNQEIIESAIRPKKEHFEIFGHKADGKSAQRVVEVIKSYVK